MLNLQTQGELRCLWELWSYGAPRDRSVQKFTLIETSSPDLTQLIWLIWSFLYQAIECHSIVIEVQTSSLDMALRANHGAWTCRDMSTKQGKISGEIDAPQHQSSQCQISRDESRVLEMEQNTLPEIYTAGTIDRWRQFHNICICFCFISLKYPWELGLSLNHSLLLLQLQWNALDEIAQACASSLDFSQKIAQETSSRPEGIVATRTWHGRNKGLASSSHVWRTGTISPPMFRTCYVGKKHRVPIVFIVKCRVDSINVLGKPRYFQFLIF